MICFICGRRLLRAAATVKTDAGEGHAGPTCARKAGLLLPVVKPKRTSRGTSRARIDSRQGSLPLQV